MKKRYADTVSVHEVYGNRSVEINEFIRFPFRLYSRCSQWVPWFDADVKKIVARQHPFFEHSEGAFFIGRRNEETVGRIAVFHNTRYNALQNINAASFYFFDAFNDQDVTHALFETIGNWAKARNLDLLIGPILFGGVTGAGILIDGFEHRSAMTMMNYNHPYYRSLLENEGFQKKLDLNSACIDTEGFKMPEKVRRIAEIALTRGKFKVLQFNRKSKLKQYAPDLGKLYNDVLGDHVESQPLTENEIKKITKDLLMVADPRLIKLLTYQDEIAGFLFAFPDLSEALKRCDGKLHVLNVIRLLREFKRTRHLIFNGAGILPKYQRLGGNALLYHEIERTCQSRSGHYVRADLTQIAETTAMMLSDIKKLGAKIYKIHRMYEREI